MSAIDQDGTRTWEATGRDDFLGWAELVREKALLEHPELKDVMAMREYPDKDTLPGTYRTAANSHKLDYLFLSTALQAKVNVVGVERRGYKSAKWPHFDTVVDARSQASDHHCVWVDLTM